MRLHSVIVAAGLGVPVVALSYDSKVNGFCAEAGLSDVCEDLADLDAAWLGTAVSEASLYVGNNLLNDYRSRSSAVEEFLAAWG